ncbi:Chlorophyll(ide) b reductase NOL, chloroplastic [Glycine soja]
MASTTTLSFHFPYPTTSTLSSHSQLSPSPQPSQFKPCTVASRQNLCTSNTLSVSASRKNSTSPIFLATASGKSEPMLPPFNVLITGSTKGIGYALAKEFLKAGDNVLICSRSDERVKTAVQNLRVEFGEQHVWGTKCDVKNAEDVKNLVSFAQEKMKYIDIWINNAGSNAYSYKPLVEASDEDLIEVVTTNTLGLMICCREAIKMMVNQPRGGHIFNIDGAGSDGRPTPRFAAYGATKRSVVHLTKSLQNFNMVSKACDGQHGGAGTDASGGTSGGGRGHGSGRFANFQSQAELRMQDVKNVVVHNLSPGMVTTDLLMSGVNTKQAKFFINVLAEPAEVVAEYLVPNIRSVPANGSMKPTYIRFLTGLKAYSQIFSRLAFGARRNRYILED